MPGLGYGGSPGGRSAFSSDGRTLFYLVRKRGSRPFNSAELRIADLDSGRTAAALPGVLMSDFDIAPDGELVTFEEAGHVWVASLDRSTPPRQLTSSVSFRPFFGPGGDIYFQANESGRTFVYSVGPDEAMPRKINPEPVAVVRYFAPWRLVALRLEPSDRPPNTRRVPVSRLRFLQRRVGTWPQVILCKIP